MWLGLRVIALASARGRTTHKQVLAVGMAGTTRLELATSAVTGQRSNQLNYVPANVHLLVGGHGFEPRTFPV